MPESKIWRRDLPLGRFLNLLTKSYYGALVKKLEHLEIDKDYSILILVESNAGHCSQQFLCDSLHMDKASMVKRIDILAEKGLIERCENPKDRREHKLVLTRKAQE